jgi:DNA-binding response OmpR family regulator
MAKGLIIIVEDEAIIRKVYEKGLGDCGYTVVSAKSGEEGLSLLSVNKPILAILDINLPGLSGIEVCDRARGLLSSVPIIFISSNDTPEVLHECINAGGDDFIIKGQSINYILERVAYWTRGGGRKLHATQREQIIAKIGVMTEDAAEERAGQKPELLEIANAYDAHCLDLPETYGRKVSERMMLFGYLTGLVNAQAQTNLKVKISFLDYLRDALIQNGLARPDEIDLMFESLHELYENEVFRNACSQAEADFAERQG